MTNVINFLEYCSQIKQKQTKRRHEKTIANNTVQNKSILTEDQKRLIENMYRDLRIGRGSDDASE